MPIKKKGSRAKYKHKKIESKSHFAKGSFRTVPAGKKSKVVIGCPKGKYSKKTKRCKVGTRAVTVLKKNPGKKRAIVPFGDAYTPVDHLIMHEHKTGKVYWDGAGFSYLKENAVRYHGKEQVQKIAHLVADRFRIPVKIVTD